MGGGLDSEPGPLDNDIQQAPSPVALSPLGQDPRHGVAAISIIAALRNDLAYSSDDEAGSLCASSEERRTSRPATLSR